MFDDPNVKEGRGRNAPASGANAGLIKVSVTKTGLGSKKDEVECTIEPKPGSEPYVSNNQINLPQHGGPFRIEFELADPLAWASSDPFNTRVGNCPPPKANDDEHMYLQSPNGKFLTVLNLNGGTACDIHYRMNFDDGTYCDPIMNNGGN